MSRPCVMEHSTVETMKKSKTLFESVTDVVVFGICAVILLRILAVYIGGSEVCMKRPVCQLQWLH